MEMPMSFKSNVKQVRLLPHLLAAGLFAVVTPLSVAHATWSVVAVDPRTGQVGAAGASCYPGVDTIARVVPGKGVVVAQGLTSDPGRDHAAKMLQEGNSADVVVDTIKSSKVDKSFFAIRQLRQYGVASLHGGQASVASSTGALTQGARGSREAAGVAVQGNILANDNVLNQTLDQFVKTSKSCDLAVALLNALEAGAREGGDKRCPAAQSAMSAFLIVAQPGDKADAPSVRLIAPNQQRGAANPVLMLRQQLRDRFAQQAIAPDECAF
jgi:uncharacterized Ntn-hydrolase superfamily protein